MKQFSRQFFDPTEGGGSLDYTPMDTSAPAFEAPSLTLAPPTPAATPFYFPSAGGPANPTTPETPAPVAEIPSDFSSQPFVSPLLAGVKPGTPDFDGRLGSLYGTYNTYWGGIGGRLGVDLSALPAVERPSFVTKSLFDRAGLDAAEYPGQATQAANLFEAGLKASLEKGGVSDPFIMATAEKSVAELSLSRLKEQYRFANPDRVFEVASGSADVEPTTDSFVVRDTNALAQELNKLAEAFPAASTSPEFRRYQLAAEDIPLAASRVNSFKGIRDLPAEDIKMTYLLGSDYAAHANDLASELLTNPAVALAEARYADNKMSADKLKDVYAGAAKEEARKLQVGTGFLGVVRKYADGRSEIDWERATAAGILGLTVYGQTIGEERRFNRDRRAAREDARFAQQLAQENAALQQQYALERIGATESASRSTRTPGSAALNVRLGG